MSEVSEAKIFRIAAVAPETRDLSDRIREAGGEPVAVGIPAGVPGWGVALRREWIADALEISLSDEDLSAIVFSADSDAELSGILVAALRLGVPAVCASPPDTPFAASIAALGFTPLDGKDVAKVAVGLASDADIPDGTDVAVDNFSIANALRVALALGCGTEAVMHIAAIGRQAGVVGFRRMMEVLISEAAPLSLVGDEWFRRNGLHGVIRDLTDELHDTPTVSGPLRDFGKAPGSHPPGTGFGYTFIQAKSSRAEMICTIPDGTTEFYGRCSVFDSEAEAIEYLRETIETETTKPDDTKPDDTEPDDVDDVADTADDEGIGDSTEDSLPAETPDEEKILLVVRRCGSKGEPGVRVLEDVARAIRELGVEERVAVITDGLAPEGATGVWASGFSPEAASSGVIGRLEDDDFIKLDFEEGRILTSIPAKDLARRRLARPAAPTSPAYVARYARSARSTLDGASFG